jgi:hypothetical protein
MVSAQTYGLIVVAIVLIVVVLGIFFFLSRRLRRRRDQILGELKDKPELVQDRAFNRLAMARREVSVVGRTGSDVARAQDLIAQSQSAFDQRDFAHSYQLAQSAHEALVNTRQSTSPLPSAPTMRAPPAAGTTRSAAGPNLGTAAAAPPPAAPMPRNRAESHFQIGLLDSELETARKDRPSAGPTLEASALRTQAQAAFDRADYTEAFRLSLRARRVLGGHVEALAPSPGGRGAAAAAPAPDAEAAAERTAAAERCPSCGYPTSPTDAFCRGCGIPRTPAACPACGAERSGADTFCGRCGARFSA